MNTRAIGFRIASLIFALMVLAHLLRLILRVAVVVGHHTIPMWTSGVAIVVAGALSIWLWKLSKK